MTPSHQAYRLGCISLVDVSRKSGISQRTLINWHKTRPFVFIAICEKVARENLGDASKDYASKKHPIDGEG